MLKNGMVRTLTWRFDVFVGWLLVFFFFLNFLICGCKASKWHACCKSRCGAHLEAARSGHVIKPVIVLLLSFLMMLWLWLWLGLWLWSSLVLVLLLWLRLWLWLVLLVLSLLFLKVPFVGFLYKLLKKTSPFGPRNLQSLCWTVFFCNYCNPWLKSLLRLPMTLPNLAKCKFITRLTSFVPVIFWQVLELVLWHLQEASSCRLLQAVSTFLELKNVTLP